MIGQRIHVICGMPHLSLFELTNLVKSSLEKNLEPSYWVVAEISELRLNPKGHCYLELVEKEGNFVSAKIRANIWAYTYRNLSGWFEAVTHTSLQPGIKVLFNASVQFHELYGMSLNVKDIDPSFTLGERARKKQEVIQQLKDDGVFDLNKEISLPLVPQRIAIISSETAAGYGDFMNHITLNPHGYTFKTELFQSLMQGDQASKSMIRALHQVHERIPDFDVVALIRGGGSQVDLDCFDDYELNAHIAQFPLPVVTGIGHERDETIADLVANTRMKTPTAVAEFLISGLQRFEERLDEKAYVLERLSTNLTQLAAHEIIHYGHALRSAIKESVYTTEKQLSEQKFKFKYAVQEFFKAEKRKVDNFKTPLKTAKSHRLKNAEKKLDGLEKQLQLLSPDSALKRGYSITLRNGKFIAENNPIKEGDELETITHKLKIISKVKSVSNGQ